MTEEQKRPRLRNYYEKEVVNNLMGDFSFKNKMQVPRLEKIVIIWDWVKPSKILRRWRAQSATWDKSPVKSRW